MKILIILIVLGIVATAAVGSFYIMESPNEIFPETNEEQNFETDAMTETQKQEYQKYLKEMEKEMAKMSPEQREQFKQMQELGYEQYMEEYMKVLEQSNESGAGAGTGTQGGIGGGGGATKDIYEISAQRQREAEVYIEEIKTISNVVKIELTALSLCIGYFASNEGYTSPNIAKATAKIEEIERENNISDDASQMIPTVILSDPALGPKAEQRYNEIINQGL